MWKDQLGKLFKLRHNIKAEECSLCLKRGRLIRNLECSHKFHEACIKRWRTKHLWYCMSCYKSMYFGLYSCPMCRNSYRVSQNRWCMKKKKISLITIL